MRRRIGVLLQGSAAGAAIPPFDDGTAQRLGVAFPAPLLLAADEVIS